MRYRTVNGRLVPEGLGTWEGDAWPYGYTSRWCGTEVVPSQYAGMCHRGGACRRKKLTGTCGCQRQFVPAPGVSGLGICPSALAAQRACPPGTVYNVATGQCVPVAMAGLGVVRVGPRTVASPNPTRGCYQQCLDECTLYDERGFAVVSRTCFVRCAKGCPLEAQPPPPARPVASAALMGPCPLTSAMFAAATGA